MAKNTVQWYAMLMVADKYGFSLVPLNYRYKFDEVNYIIGDSDAKSLFIDEERIPVFQERRDELPAAVKGQGVLHLEGRGFRRLVPCLLFPSREPGRQRA